MAAEFFFFFPPSHYTRHAWVPGFWYTPTEIRMQVDDHDHHDHGSKLLLTDISELDKLPWDAKLAHVLRVAQPFGKTPGPWFPLSNLEKAASQIVAAARHATFLCGLDDQHPEIHKNRDPKAIQAWVDTWTHPGVYQHVFQDWIGHVYTSRADTQYISHKAETEWHKNPQARGPVWYVKGTEHRGIPDLEVSKRMKKNLNYGGIPDSADLTGLRGSTKPYQHAWPERYGHATHLVPWKQSAMARAVLGNDLSNAYDIPEGEEPPKSVVRLVDISWYLAGFLGSMLIWTHLALEVTREQLHGLSREKKMVTSVDLKQLITSPAEFFPSGSVLYSFAWKGLVKQLEHIPKARLQTPFPDMIRMPQEWCAVMSERQGFGMDTLEITGVPGHLRRMVTQFPIQDSPEYTVESMQPLLSLRGLQEIHMGELADARRNNKIPRRAFDIVERYLPMPDPPHPVAGLFLPWTSITPPAKTGTKHAFEQVNRLTSLVRIRCCWICIPCMETGLALEEWGRTWTQKALDALIKRETWSAKDVMAFLNRGEKVPLWDPGTVMRKSLILESVQNLDPEGPMGDGYRFYTADDILHGNGPAWPRPTPVLEAQSWLRLERMTTTVYLSLSGPEQSLIQPTTTIGIWEDSGLEVSSYFIRRQGRHMPLLQCAINIMPSVAGREASRQNQRYWQLKVFDPWPVHSELHMVDLSQLDPIGLRRALVIRTLVLKQVIFPDRHWLHNLLIYLPPPVKTGTDHGVEPQPPDILTRSARLSLTHLQVSMLSFPQPVPVGWPNTPLEKVQLATVLLPPAGFFRHYPNLRIIQLTHLKLGRIPPGFLTFAINTVRRRPMGQTAAYDMASTFLACSLDHTDIGGLDDWSLLALVQFVRKHRINTTADLHHGLGELVSTRVPIDLRINLSHTPFELLVDHKYGGDVKNYLKVRSAELIKQAKQLASPTTQQSLVPTEHRSVPKGNTTRASLESRSKGPLDLLQWWKKYEVDVNLNLLSMLVFLPPWDFDAMVREKFGSLMQYRWI